MRKYCWKCPGCGHKTVLPEPEYERLVCYHPGGPDGYDILSDNPMGGTDMVRDYKAEAVGVGTGVAMSRTGTARDQAQLFLPSNDEFKGPGDPDGTKGAREWLDSHAPKENGGHNPLLDIERRSF